MCMETNDFVNVCGKSKPTFLYKGQLSINFECYISEFDQEARKAEKTDQVWVLALFFVQPVIYSANIACFLNNCDPISFQ